MNFGDLLFALNCDRLKNEIRKIEKINRHIVQSKNGFYFNEIYIYNFSGANGSTCMVFVRVLVFYS